MSAKDIRIKDSQQALLRGVTILTDAVKSTLGPCGRNVMFERSFGGPRVTKDGVSVAKEIELSDRFENMGAQMVKEVASKTADTAGDGTTTATVLAHAFFEEGLKGIAARHNPIDIKRGMEKAVALVKESILSKSVSIKGDSAKIRQVATISANSDADLGTLVATAMEKVGEEGVITVEESKSIETEVVTVEGMQFDRGLVSMHFATNAEKMSCELDNPYVLIYDKKISTLHSIVNILQAIMQAGRPVLIIAEDIDGEALPALIINRIRGGLKVAAVKAPGFGDRRKAMLEDIAILTGGQVISEELGLTLEKMQLSDLGQAQRIVVDRESTIIVEGGVAKSQNAVNNRCAEIRQQIDTTTSDYDKEKLQERLAKLCGGVAVIRVGGATEAEVKEKKDRVDDAAHATRAAVAEGIVAGGGVALIHAGKALEKAIAEMRKSSDHGKKHDESYIFGMQCVLTGLSAPARHIANNAGKEGIVVVNQINTSTSHNYGYDAHKDVYGDMFEMGVIDPTKVVLSALQNAASIAGMFVTTEVMIAEKPKEGGEKAMPGHGMGGGMDF